MSQSLLRAAQPPDPADAALLDNLAGVRGQVVEPR
jgi:hypothetical protein